MEQYFATYVQDLEQDPFDPIDFVERLAWRMTGGSEEVDAVVLKNKFEEEIGNLQMLSDQFQKKINRLETQSAEERRGYSNDLRTLYEKNGAALIKLKELDNTMHSVSAKVVHLGDQLEAVHAPRARAHEALQLMRHFDEFLAEQSLSSEIFTDPDNLLESAEMIQKLHSISQELSREKYSAVQARIAHRYDEIERLMIEEFTRAQRIGDRSRMQAVAAILVNFKGYSQCLDAFIEQVQVGAFRGDKLFVDVLTLCQKTHPMIEEIFPNPPLVMSKLILNLFHGKIQEMVNAKVGNAEAQREIDVYLTELNDLYSKTIKLSGQLECYRLATDSNFMSTLIRPIFLRYLDCYFGYEERFLHDQCSSILQRFYDSKGHQKRQIQSGGLQDIKRDIQARIMSVETFGGESFLSEVVAINILQETKNAFQRCGTLSSEEEAPMRTKRLLELLMRYLCHEHVDYAVELGLSGISLAEPKTPPPVHFLAVVQQAGTIIHLFDKQFEDSIHPLIKGTPIERGCVEERSKALRALETKMNTGLDRLLSALVGYVRFVLQSEQKKADFRPEDDAQMVHLNCSSACKTVVRFLKEQVERIRANVDGANLTAILTDLGQRLYKTIAHHINQFIYSSAGAMLLLCDINEYRKCVMPWKIARVSRSFDELHALANLLVVVPSNLPAACESQLLDIDHSVIVNVVQLRADYRSAKLYTEFR